MWVGVGLFACGPLPSEEVEEHSEDVEFGDPEEAKKDTSGCNGIATPDTGLFGKQIALTFDDGVNLDSTPKVLDILKSRGVKVTFLVVGRTITTEAHRDVLRRMKAEGHLVGSHSWSHPNFKAISYEKAKQQVLKTKKVLAEVGIFDPYFRFPYGNATCKTAAFVRAQGYHVVGWDFGSGDWCYNVGHGFCPKKTYKYMAEGHRHDQLKYIKEVAAKNQGGVMLNHDSHLYTVETLDGILTALKSEGYTFVRLDDVSVFPKMSAAN